MAKELYVGHISEQATEDDLRKLFSLMGPVTSVHLIVDQETGEFKRCGYVRMLAEVDLKEVVETLDGTWLIDRCIVVSIAKPQKDRPAKTTHARRKPGETRRPEAAREPLKGGKPTFTKGTVKNERPATAGRSEKNPRPVTAKDTVRGERPVQTGRPLRNGRPAASGRKPSSAPRPPSKGRK
ncbi:MAG: RNA-binding protein [Deltaproteobacteria bacterium]|nr:RNA-binding protein [Deltaproteobacteria bacterium]